MKKNNFIRLLVLIMVVISSINTAWADSYIDGFGLQFYEDGSNPYNKTNGDIDDGTKMSFGNKTCDWTIAHVYANIKKNGENVCGDAWFGWQIFGPTGTNWASPSPTSDSWGGDYHYTHWGTEYSSASRYIELVKNRLPGDYNLQFIFSWKCDGSCNTTRYCKYSNNNWKISWTIPEPTITITGASSLVVGTSTNITAAISNYPVGATLTNVSVSGNIASTASNTGTDSSITVSSVTPNASGANGITVTVTVTYGSAGTKDYVYTYDVTPPAVSDYTVTPSGSGYLSSGSGTAGSPWLVTYNGTLTLGLSGATQAYTDANSAAEYSTNGGSSYGTTGSNISITRNNITSTSNADWNFKARLKNTTTSSLLGAVNEKTVYWKVPTYTVTLDKNGGGADGSATATHGRTSLSPLSAPTKTGYSVEGYYSKNGSGDDWGNKVATSAGALQASATYTDASSKWNSLSNQTLYTKWTANNYSITLDKGTGGTTGGSASVTYDNTALTTVSHATKAGYSLAGYYDADGTTKVLNADGTFANSTVSGYITSGQWTKAANCTLYAHWTENDYTVTVNASAGGSVASASVAGHIDTKVTLPAATADPGYYFTGWTTTTGSVTYTNQSSATSAQVNGLTAAATVQANFLPIWRVACSSDSYNTENHKITTITASAGVMTSGSVTIDLNANTDYDLKIYNKSTDKWWGHSGEVTEITYENQATAQSLLDDTESNQTFRTAGKGTYTFTWNVSRSEITITYPTSYTVTFGEGTGNGTAVTASVESSGAINSGDYAAAGKDITFSQAPATGYTFAGWYTAASGGSAIACMGTSDHVYDDIAADINVYAQYTAISSTVTFDATTNGGNACTPGSKTVTYDAAYGTLPMPTHPSQQFVGWYTTASGAGSQVTASTIVTATSDHTIYARFESVYRVDVTYKCGSDVLAPATYVDASHTSLTPTITAPEIFGYNFVNWTENSTSYVTFADDDAASTTITTTGAATITANYSVEPMVFFKNNLGWEEVYVTFDAYTDGSAGNAPGNKTKPYYKMTRIGTSDIFYCDIPSTYTASNYASWANTIAFDNHGFDYSTVEAAGNIGTWQAFNEGEFLYRGDFDPKTTLFIPYNGDTESRNGGTYYDSGCWMKYNSTESGYQVNMNTLVEGARADILTVYLTAHNAGEYKFSAKLNLTSPNYSYGFKLYKITQKNSADQWYTNTGEIYADTETLPWDFHSGPGVNADSKRCALHTESLGDYIITVSFETGKPMVDVEYPVVVGDWKLIYKDRAAWSNGAHTASWNHPSRVIKAKANAEDIVSFYVAYGSTPSVELWKCTAINALTGAQTWAKQGSDLDISSITKIGIYNFKIRQDAEKTASLTAIEEYNGNYYIRTDASDGGWANYMAGKNDMTYSEYAAAHDFTHYFMRYVPSGNIKFCIANDYSECISDTLVDDTYSGENIAVYGNVRFMWDQRTNKVSRAYISGSAFISDRFLVLEGDAKMFNVSGETLTTAGGGKVDGLNDYEMNFTDDQNWIYETTVTAQPGARIKLTAKYNNKIQYFYGAEGERSDETTELLIGGSGTNLYEVRVVYDFKTNRLLKAFVPEGEIGTSTAIDADLMIIREHQEAAKQISFSGSGITLSKVKTVYGAMKFNKYTVNGKEKTGGHAATGESRYKRDLFYISFPFEVKLNDVFGFGTYGKHWIIEYYDGKGRAKNGFWADSDPNWKFVMPSERRDFILNAFEGYILALDLDEMTESSSVWNNGVENVYIYFPSSAEVENITATTRLIPINQEGYRCTIGPRFPGGDDRREKDSYWHCIGVPSFADHSGALTETAEGGAIDWSDDDGTIDWSTPSFPYLYEWNWADNSVSVTRSADFDFKATWSYLVQYAGESIYWSNINVTPAAIVARERKAPTNAEFRIELQQAGEKADQTFVRLTDEENVTTGFDFNYDLSKEFNRNKANIYTMVTTVKEDGPSITEVAGNVQPMTEQTTVVPMGVTIAKAGEYTIAIPSGTNGIGVTLVDNETGLRTNLALEDYTVALEAGTQNDRFYLEISPITHVATGIENSDVSIQNSDVRKVMVDGLLYIIKDGKVFDAQGSRVK